MKKSIFRFLVTVFAVILGAMSMVGCGGSDDDWGSGGNNKNVITALITEEGYGSEWLTALSDAYYQKTGIKLHVDKSYIKGEIHTLLEEGTLAYDLAFPAGGLGIYNAEAKNLLVDLTSVYEATPEGSDKPIKEMMPESIYNDFKRGDKIYQMSWMESRGSLIYNKTSLDEAFGEGNYTLPRTTNEWKELCDRIVAETDLYPIAFCPSIPYTYSAHLVWWAQYDGYEKYRDFFRGYYYDTDGQRKLAENGEVFDMPGRLKALEATAQFYNKNSGYLSPDAANMNFQEYQIAFLGHGYKGVDMTKYAFTINGDWLENEMRDYLEAKPQELRMIKVPMLSSITETLEDKNMSEPTLRNVISAIDNGEEGYPGVSENDYKRLSDARRMLNCGALDMHIAIPTSAKNIEKAKDFLIFMASPEGQKIVAESTNGLTMPYGYTPEKSSEFIKSCRDTYGNDFISISEDSASPLVYRQGLGVYYGLVDSAIYKGDLPANILTSTKNYYMTFWDRIIAMAK